jgi:HlyD family secretion protein
MIRKFSLPLLSLAGVAFATVTVAASYRQPMTPQSSLEPAASPFKLYVSGSGTVEASSHNVSIGSPAGRVALDVPARVGAFLKAGEVLFRLDDRDLRANLEVRRTAVTAARARLARLQGMPRAEETPALEARKVAAVAQRDDARNQLELAESVADRRAISGEEVARRRYAAKAAQARLDEAHAQLALHRAGAWREDLTVAETELASAQAELSAVESEIERMVVRAPMDGRVLQVNLRKGEFARADETAHVVFGAVDTLHLRVDIDENDAWRIKPGAMARASVRTRSDLQVKLEFEYAEPYIVPKRMLNGSAVERVDTRVLQVIYSFKSGDLPIYVGQQMDVFVDAETQVKS